MSIHKIQLFSDPHSSQIESAQEVMGRQTGIQQSKKAHTITLVLLRGIDIFKNINDLFMKGRKIYILGRSTSNHFQYLFYMFLG